MTKETSLNVAPDSWRQKKGTIKPLAKSDRENGKKQYQKPLPFPLHRKRSKGYKEIGGERRKK